MSVPSAKSPQADPVGKTANQGSSLASEIDLSGFSLRDTLSGISVRETSFSEFLSALKTFGPKDTRQ